MLPDGSRSEEKTGGRTEVGVARAGWNGARPVRPITKKTMRTLLTKGYSVQKRGSRTGLEEWSLGVEAWPRSF